MKNQNEWDDAEGRRIEMVNSCIVNKARQMFILTFLHTKGDALTVAPTVDRISHGAVKRETTVARSSKKTKNPCKNRGFGVENSEQ